MQRLTDSGWVDQSFGGSKSPRILDPRKSPRHLLSNSRRGMTPGQYFPSHEQEEDDRAYDLHRELDAFGRDDRRATHQEDSEDEDSSAEWDEESTLVAMLQDDSSDKDDQEDVAALIDQLKAPMAAQGLQLKQYMRDTLVPVIHQVKQVHEKIEDKVDLAYGTGLLAFDEVCKRVEAIALRDEDEVRTAYLDLQKNMKKHLAELDQAYRHRDQLWVSVEEKLQECADRAKAAIESLPSEVEQTIARIDKQSKEMEKNKNSVASKQKMLKTLLANL